MASHITAGHYAGGGVLAAWPKSSPALAESVTDGTPTPSHPFLLRIPPPAPTHYAGFFTVPNG